MDLQCFAAMVFYGVVTSLCYHMLMFVRAVIRHNTAVTDAEDILFLGTAGFFFFLTVYKNNEGILRWYTFAGAGIGCLAYVRTLGASLETVRKRLLQKRRKTVKIRTKFCSKGQVPVNEGNTPEQQEKEKKKERP